MLITALPASLTFDRLCEEVKMLCSVARLQPITLKWIDDEGGCFFLFCFLAVAFIGLNFDL